MFRKIIDKFKAAAQPDPEREVVYVSGSHGELVVDLETGFVVEYYNSQGYLFDPEPEKSLSRAVLGTDWAYYNISRFDLSVYPREVKPGDYFDILELGYLYTDYNGTVKYEWPEPTAGLTAILSSLLHDYSTSEKSWLSSPKVNTEIHNIVASFQDLLPQCEDYTGELNPPTRTGDNSDEFGGKLLWRK